MPTKQKQQGQYMTPPFIVNLILDSLEYNDNKILTKKIMEPSFGDGSFLIEIASRIINVGLSENLGLEQISTILNNNIFGIEKDSDLYRKAIGKLNQLVSYYKLPDIEWSNLTNGDTLLLYKNYIGQFDFVVGNPPFVRVHHIPNDYRDIIREFKFSDGMLDMYIVFYELSVKLLNEKGLLGFITPNSFLKNTSQKKFREYLIANKLLWKLYDFKNSKIFLDASTYTCVCLLNNNAQRNNVQMQYREYKYDETKNIDDCCISENTYSLAQIEQMGHLWNFCSAINAKFLDEIKKTTHKISDIAIVQNGITTNRDDVYVIKVYLDKDCTVPYMGKHTDELKTVYFKANKQSENKIIPIESAILRRCIKASKYNGTMSNTYIIFPYYPTQNIATNIEEEHIECGYTPFDETTLQKRFPLAYQYLSSAKDILAGRDMETNIPWFAFARSQGMTNAGYKKVVFKHTIEKHQTSIIPHVIDKDVLVYSGIYSTIKPTVNMEIIDIVEYENKLTQLSNIFASDNFAKYCTLIGKDMSGEYVSVSTKMISGFGY